MINASREGYEKGLAKGAFMNIADEMPSAKANVTR